MLRNIKSILILGFLLILFVGNVGVNIFKHVCAEDGISVSYFVQTAEECNNHDEILTSCCSASKGTFEDQFEDDCCSDIVAYFNLKLDYFESYDSFNFSPLLGASIHDFSVNFQSFGFEEVYVAHTYEDPPPIGSQSMRIARQVFII